MEATISTKNSDKKKVSEITLVEETGDDVFVQDEENEEQMKKFFGVELLEVEKGCRRIGIEKSDKSEIKNKIDDQYIVHESEKSIDLKPVIFAHQSEEMIDIRFKSGSEVSVKGNLATAYTY